MTLEKGIHGWVVTATGLAADRVRWAKQGQAVPRPAAPGAWVSLSELGREAGGADWQERAAYPLTFTDLAVAAVNAGADTLTITAHGRATGDGPVRLETTGVAPGGLAVATDYWLIVVDANTVQLAATFLDAIDLVEVAIADAGSGAHTVVDTAETVRAGAELLATSTGTRTATISIQCYAGAATGDTTPSAYLDRLRAALALDGVRAALKAEGLAVAVIGPTRDLGVALNSGATFEPRAVLEARVHLAAPAITETMTIIATATATGTVTA